MSTSIGRLNIKKNIKFPFNLCYKVVEDVEKYPSFQTNVENVVIHSQTDKTKLYSINHNFQLVGQKEKINYKMDLEERKIKVVGKDSEFINYIKYDWNFIPFGKQNTVIKLDLEIEFSHWSYYSFWLTFSDLLKERTINQYINRIKNLSQE